MCVSTAPSNEQVLGQPDRYDLRKERRFGFCCRFATWTDCNRAFYILPAWWRWESPSRNHKQQAM
jgi:hypothetical protein